MRASSALKTSVIGLSAIAFTSSRWSWVNPEHDAAVEEVECRPLVDGEFDRFDHAVTVHRRRLGGPGGLRQRIALMVITRVPTVATMTRGVTRNASRDRLTHR